MLESGSDGYESLELDRVPLAGVPSEYVSGAMAFNVLALLDYRERAARNEFYDSVNRSGPRRHDGGEARPEATLLEATARVEWWADHIRALDGPVLVADVAKLPAWVTRTVNEALAPEARVATRREAGKIRFELKLAVAPTPEPAATVAPTAPAPVLPLATAPTDTDRWTVWDGTLARYAGWDGLAPTLASARRVVGRCAAVALARELFDDLTSVILTRDPRGPRQECQWYDAAMGDWAAPAMN